MELEICVDSIESAIAAEEGGAQRVELCSALVEGGLTPSAGLIREVRARVAIGMHIIIRPRGGDFLYSDQEFMAMHADIAFAAQCGANGVVFGLLTEDGSVDVARTKTLVELARPMEVTFHRAFDMTKDLRSSLEEVITTGADRLLTSGAEPTAMLGSLRIRDLVRQSAGRIRIMAGGGIRPENVEELAHVTGVHEVHAALRRTISSSMQFRNLRLHIGDPDRDEYERTAVHADDVRALRQAIDSVESKSAAMRD